MAMLVRRAVRTADVRGSVAWSPKAVQEASRRARRSILALLGGQRGRGIGLEEAVSFGAPEHAAV
jgi:hypothetical protein